MVYWQGSPLGVKATLYDGSFHEVDSNEMAFKIAGSMAMKKGALDANPALLEPIMRVEVVTPEENMGDVIGDLNRRRGLVQGMDDGVGGVKTCSRRSSACGNVWVRDRPPWFYTRSRILQHGVCEIC